MPIGSVFTTSQGSGTLKRIYPEKKVYKAMNTSTPTLDLFRGMDIDVEQGLRFEIPVAFAHSEGSATKSEFTPIPQVRATSETTSFWGYTEYERPISVSAKMMKIGGAYADPLVYNTQMAVEAMYIDFDEMLHLSYTNLRATVQSASDGTTIVVDDATYIREGMPLDILVKTTGAHSHGAVNVVVATAPTYSSATTFWTFTISGGSLFNFGGLDTTFGVYKTGTYGTGSWGLPDIINDANPASGVYVGGIDRTVAGNARWKSTLIDASTRGGDISPDLIAELQTKIFLKSGKMPNFAIAHPAQINELIKQQLINRRTDYGRKTFALWGSGVEFVDGSLPIYPSRFCSKSKLWMGNKEMIRFANPGGDQGEWVEPASRKGRINLVDNRLGMIAVWYRVFQVVARLCNCHGALTGLTVPTGYADIVAQ